jgi:transglutaminase-like putative cysteine protease
MTILTITHRTVYRYARPVTLHPHRLMFRPRDSHDLRLLQTALTIQPPAQVRWMHDVFNNSIAIAHFNTKASELVFESSFRAEHFPSEPMDLMLAPYARTLPFAYSADDVIDLARTNERHYADPEHRVDQWASAFVSSENAVTLEVLIAMNRAIRQQFQYIARDEQGTQTPLETMDRGTGTCRDFALFLMEAARSLGLAARFVSGYLYDASLVGGRSGLVGGGATHAWAQIYLPGAGWVSFDPTNALVGGQNLIRVAVARDAAQAIPVSGSFTGAPSDDLGMTVDVRVTAS